MALIMLDHWYDYGAAVTAALAALGGLAGGAVAVLRGRTQSRLDISAAWERFIVPLQAEMESLRTRVAELEKNEIGLQLRISTLEEENRQLKRGVRILTRQLVEQGHDPHWHPFDDPELNGPFGAGP